MIQQRWHDDDLAGWLLNTMAEAEKEYKQEGEWPEDADRWEVVSYPALATQDEKFRKRGEALHPERYDEKALLKIKRTSLPRDWAALYQQTPVVEEGAYFQKSDFRFYTSSPPQDLYVVAAGDLAISKRDTADYTVFVVVGLDADDNIWILDVRRDRWDTDQIVDQMFDIQRRWKPRRFGIEKGHISMTMMPHLNYRKRKEKLYSLIIEELAAGKQDKEARARAIQGRMRMGQVKFPREALWIDEFINEMLRFPHGVNDDRVDAVAWIGRMLADTQYRGDRKKNRRKSWKDKLRGMASGDKSNSAMAA